MAPKEKKKSKKKSHHQSIRSVPGVIPGTSTLSLPTLGSNFPHEYPADTPSYSLDLCKLLLETSPNTNTYYDFFIHQPIQELILNLLTVHGLSNNAQAVKDYRARVQGNQPSASMSGSVKNILGDLNLSLPQKQQIMETVYRNYKAAVEYYANKSEEASKELKVLDELLRQSILEETKSFHVITSKDTSSEDIDDSDESKTKDDGQSSAKDGDIDESKLGAVGGEPSASRRNTEYKRQGKGDRQSEKQDESKSDHDSDDNSMGVGACVASASKPENFQDKGHGGAKPKVLRNKGKKDQDETDVKENIDLHPEINPTMRRKNFRKLQNLWEKISTEGSDANIFYEKENEPKEENQKTNILIADETEDDNTEMDEQPQPVDIVVPFHTSQLNIPLLRPNILITSDIGSTTLLMSTQQDESQKDSETMQERIIRGH